jgi:hypothetical protein
MLADMPQLQTRWNSLLHNCSEQLMDLAIEVHKTIHAKLDHEMAATCTIDQMHQVMDTQEVVKVQRNIEMTVTADNKEVIERKNKILKENKRCLNGDHNSHKQGFFRGKEGLLR